MKVSMHAMSVDLFAHTLGNLSSILEKAAASATQRKFDPAVLLAARLAPAIDYLRSIPASALEGSETRDIKLPAGERTLEFKGLEFLQRWAIPNVFFHVVTAYDILRHNGVELGKSDFLRGGRDP